MCYFYLLTLLNTYAYKYLPLKYSVILLPLTSFLLPYFHALFLKKEINKNQIFSYLIILTGILIYNIK